MLERQTLLYKLLVYHSKYDHNFLAQNSLFQLGTKVRHYDSGLQLVLQNLLRNCLSHGILLLYVWHLSIWKKENNIKCRVYELGLPWMPLHPLLWGERVLANAELEWYIFIWLLDVALTFHTCQRGTPKIRLYFALYMVLKTENLKFFRILMLEKRFWVAGT